MRPTLVLQNYRLPAWKECEGQIIPTNTPDLDQVRQPLSDCLEVNGIWGFFRMVNVSAIAMLKRKLGQKIALLTAGCIAMTAGITGQTGGPLPIQPQSVPASEATGGRLKFDVASIHLGEPGKFMPPSFSLNIDDTPIPPGGSFRADFPLRVYIEFAYKLQLSREQREAMLSHLPKWVSTQAFVIQAKAAGNPTKDQIRLMMRALLVDRFKLTAHFETKEMPVLALELIKSGVTGRRLRPHAQGVACDAKWTAPLDRSSPHVEPGAFVPDCGDVSLIDGPNHTLLLGARNIPMEHIADYLPSVNDFGRPVVDETGLKGTFDFSLNWAPDPNDPASILPSDSRDSEGPSFLEALKEQLGLTLKPKTAPVKTLIIDHVEQPSPN